MSRLAEVLPAQIRDMDCVAQPFAHIVTLLVAGEPEAFSQLRRRLLMVWEHAWQQAGLPAPAAAFVDRHVALSGPEDAEAFRTAADVWLAEH
jgi:hypothetical protein